MKKKFIPLIIIIGFAVLLSGSLVLYNSLKGAASSKLSSKSEQSTTDAEETPAPDFTVYDKDGNKVNLWDFKGKPTVINFWASWCGPCKSEMPAFEEKYKTLGDEVNFLMVNYTDGSQETVESASKYIASQGYTFPVYYDPDASATIAYRVYSVPATYFIDAEGNMVAHALGAIDGETLQQGIDMITE